MLLQGELVEMENETIFKEVGRINRMLVQGDLVEMDNETIFKEVSRIN